MPTSSWRILPSCAAPSNWPSAGSFIASLPTSCAADGNWIDKLFYAGNDFFQYLSCLHHPFATGMFMLFDLKKFRELGGFHEQVLFAEDYLLSQQVERKRFGIVRGGVYTTNRRFQKMGHLRVGWLFLKTAMNYWNENYFLRDHKYWQT